MKKSNLEFADILIASEMGYHFLNDTVSLFGESAMGVEKCTIHLVKVAL